MRRVPKKILNDLRAARDAATMANASFGFPHDTVTASHHLQDTVTQHPDEYIKEATRLYRQSWIIGPLDNAIRWAEGHGNS